MYSAYCTPFVWPKICDGYNTDDILIEINKKSKLNSQVTFDGANNLTIESPDKIVIKELNGSS